MGLCLVDKCNNKTYAKGYCRCHYRHINEGGHSIPLIKHEFCSSCGQKMSQKAGSSGLCRKCYYKKWTNDNKEAVVLYSKEYHIKNKETISKQQKQWKIDNPDRAKELAHKRMEKIENRIAHRLRNGLRGVLKGRQKSGSTVNLLGCSLSEFRLHIESQFQPGMSWDNWGVVTSKDSFKWHMDHIDPISKFDLTDAKQMAKACHYTNLQPLWGLENMSKGNKIDYKTKETKGVRI